MKEDVEELKKELEEVKHESFAMQMLTDYKNQNKRLFIIILVILIMFAGLLGYTIWLLNDIGTIEETTQEVTQENENGYNNFIGNDGDITNGKTDN